MAIIGDEIADSAPAFLDGKARVLERSSSNQILRFDQSASAQAARLRKEARAMPAGVRLDDVLRRARLLDHVARTDLDTERKAR